MPTGRIGRVADAHPPPGGRPGVRCNGRHRGVHEVAGAQGAALAGLEGEVPGAVAAARSRSAVGPDDHGRLAAELQQHRFRVGEAWPMMAAPTTFGPVKVTIVDRRVGGEHLATSGPR